MHLNNPHNSHGRDIIFLTIIPIIRHTHTCKGKIPKPTKTT